MTSAVLTSLMDMATELRTRGISFALVGGLAVSVRGEPRFTADVDLAIAVPGDREVESLVLDLRGRGYEVRALVEHDTRNRVATVRLRNKYGIVVDLLAASSGVEPEIVAAATPVAIEGVGQIPIATAEDLLATKVLAMTPRREQDRLDARNLLLVNPTLDLEKVRERLELIRARGFAREQDLDAKLRDVLSDANAESD
jgi:hypothetical protein